VVHVRHADSLRLLGNRVLALLLRPDEEHRAVPRRDVPEKSVSLLEQRERLLQIDDVDAAPLREDEAAHLGVPAASLVTEMDAGLQQLPHRDDGHEIPPRLSEYTGGRRMEPGPARHRHPPPRRRVGLEVGGL
jgi:hypothetical protein